MNFGLIHSVWTVLLVAVFAGIVIWAWSSRRKAKFDEAARMPLEDDDGEAARDDAKR
jgi:cytochrome c oxidase cbb3-type subunit 4